MSDSTTKMDTISASQASKEVTANQSLDALSQAAIFGRRASTTTALTWGYYGGRFTKSDGTNINVANGTKTLTVAATNYVEVDEDGVVTVNTSAFTAGQIQLYTIVVGASTVTSYTDHRDGTHGNYLAQFPATHVATAGRHAIYIAAGSLTPSATGGCAVLATINSASNQPDIQTLDFDTTTQEYAQFGIVMPKSWDEGTVTFKAHWSHAATTTNFGVVFDLQAVAVGNDDAIAVAFGTAQTVTDTGGTTDDLYTSPESSAITIAGTPAAEDMVFFRLSRVTGNGSDTMAIDARLHGITLYITTDAENDA